LKNMSGDNRSDGVALETLVFIINALKEHEKQLDQLISGLCAAEDDQTNNIDQFNNKIKKFEEKTTRLQSEIDHLKSYVSLDVNAAPIAESKTDVAEVKMPRRQPTVLRCRQWEDFQSSAIQADTLAFEYKETEKTFRVDALKGNQIVTYSGEVPTLETLFKTWLSKQLEITDAENMFGASDQRNADEVVAKGAPAVSPEIVAIACNAESKGP